MSAPRLLMVLNDAPFFVTHRLPVALAARDAGVEVHVAAPYEAAAVDVIRRAGLHHHDIPLKRGARRVGGELALIAALWRIVGAVKPDLLHAVTMKPVLYAGLVARVRRVPAVTHAITGLGYLFLIDGLAARIQRAIVKRLYRFALRHPNAVAIFQNPDDLDLFRTNQLVDPAITVMIRGCGVDMNTFAQQPEPEGKPVVVFPARVLGDKGVHEFVAAARQLHDRADFSGGRWHSCMGTRGDCDLARLLQRHAGRLGASQHYLHAVLPRRIATGVDRSRGHRARHCCDRRAGMSGDRARWRQRPAGAGSRWPSDGGGGRAPARRSISARPFCRPGPRPRRSRVLG